MARAIAGAICTTAVLSAYDATAADKSVPTPPLPNVLLLIDNSGSMEHKINGQPATCTPGVVGTEPNRWGILIQALAGTIPEYSCGTMSRAVNTNFDAEYSIGGRSPYDVNYALPFHRPLSGSGAAACAWAPYYLPGAAAGSGVGVGGLGSGASVPGVNAGDFPSNGLGTFSWSDLTALPAATKTGFTQCTFEQSRDGAIDTARDLVRFGMMTFDNDVAEGTGVNSGALLVASTPTTPFTGMWSYYNGWTTGGAGFAAGKPENCPGAPPAFEVGGRNWAAPPWEGRMVRFPDFASTLADLGANNDIVKKVINAARPYGATPINGMLADAEYYFMNDPIGPYGAGSGTDPYVTASYAGGKGCRDQYIILLSDGAPNLDLRPSCMGTAGIAGVCPYGAATPPDVIAANLYNTAGRPSVKTFVIGFGTSTDALDPIVVGSSSYATCADFKANTTDFTTGCAGIPTAGSRLEACCTLEKIALAGNAPGSHGAYFADTPGALGSALSAILGSIAQTTSSRVTPTYSPVTNSVNSSFAVSSYFLANFKANTTGTAVNTSAKPWEGNIQRVRSICTASGAAEQAIDTASGDDFQHNLDAATGARKYLSAYDSTGHDSSATMRPFITGTDPDGIGLHPSKELGGVPANIASGLGASDLRTALGSCAPFTDGAGVKYGALSATDCAQAALHFAIAQPYSASATSAAPFNTYTFSNLSRETGNPRNFSAFGPILHSSAAVAPPPSGLLRDDSYQKFSQINASRPPVLYVATNDGLLHAFDVGDTKSFTSATSPATTPGAGFTSTNELWAFLPPAIHPRLLSNFPGGQQNLLDGSPIVKDVVFARTQSQTTDSSKWHTALVAGFGQSNRGYFAIDVTDPYMSSSFTGLSLGAALPATPSGVPAAASSPPVGGAGPHFLWQLTGVSPAAGEVELFGQKSVTPAITTVFIDIGGTKQEVGVAILPGGIEDGPFGDCPRDAVAPVGPYTAANSSIPSATTGWGLRANVRKWTHNSNCLGNVAGRSVTIVRLDTGAILRTFGRKSATAAYRDLPAAICAAGAGNLCIDTRFDSPMTGVPVVYPTDVGAVAQQVFIGDADGTLWKMDLTSTNPSDWTTVPFFDLYNTSVMTAATLPTPTDTATPKPATPTEIAFAAQPIALAPVLSTDVNGNLIITVASGDQDTFAVASTRPGSSNPQDLVATYTFIYSITQKLDTGSPVRLRAYPNWYIPFKDGEKVTGPMAVFSRGNYFATFAPLGDGTNVCTSGQGRLYGMDFINPASGCTIPGFAGCGSPAVACGCGGVPVSAAYTPYSVPGGPAPANPDLVGKIIPGVSIRATPTCTDPAAAATQTDDYVGGSRASLAGITPGSYSLFANVGASKGTTGIAGQQGATISQALPTPSSATVVDSWATVVE